MHAEGSNTGSRWRPRGRRKTRALLAVLGALLAADATRAQPSPDHEPLERQIEAIARSGHHPDLHPPRFPALRNELLAAYEPRHFAPVWLAEGRPTDAAAEATRLLAAADAQGLVAADYDAARLEAARRELASGGLATAATLASFDTGITLALLRQLSDLHGGRIDPKQLSFDYEIDPKHIDVVARLTTAVHEGDLAGIFSEVSPPLAQYRRLLRHLARYRALARDSRVGPVVVPQTLRPGDPAPGADGLARWLAALGDLPAPPLDPESVYGNDLVEAVRRFQTRHGLTPDGVIGPATARTLAVPAEQRVRQIELALERLRWIPVAAGERAVFVNIPAFELVAVDAVGSDAEPALTMRVVVGKAGTRTPVFSGALETVVFAPHWNVPRSITVQEELPKLRRNLGELTGRHFEIVQDGAVLPANEASLDALATGRARLRQRPGPGNALGRVKFLFPNAHNVYLHDTPSRQLFSHSRRDFSHGCIRVEKPTDLAEWVLRERSEWPPEAIRAAMAGTRETFVRVDPPVAVVIVYATAVARTNGTISFFEDLYGYDAALERALAERAR